MTNTVVYVDSGASGANDGTSWANAYTTLEAAIAAKSTTGMDFYTKSTHAEAKGSALSLTFKGAAATPDRFFSSGTTNSPPTTGDLTVGANLNTTSGALTVNGYGYLYGATLTPGTGAAITVHSTAPSELTLDTCKFVQVGAAAAINLGFVSGSNNGGRLTLINTTLKFSNTSSNIQVRSGVIRLINCSIDGAGSLPTSLFSGSSNTGTVVVICDGCDFSVLTSKAITTALANSGAYQFINCKLPTGMTVGVPTQPGSLAIDFINCDSGSTNYKQSRYMYQGTLTQDTGVYNNASDGTTAISWQVITTANANPQSPFECFDIIQWVPPGTYAASKVFATSATGSLKTNDVWVEVQYLGASYPLGVGASTLGAGSGTTLKPQQPQGDSPYTGITTGATWATGGLGTNYSLDIPSFTTSAAGYVRFKVKVGKLSLTINIDPKVTIA